MCIRDSFSPYDSPYAAYINYMNVLSDFLVRVSEQFPASIENEELNSLLLTIRNQAKEIEALRKEVVSIRTNEREAEPDLPEEDAMGAEAPSKPVKKPATRKPTAKKATARKPATKKTK